MSAPASPRARSPFRSSSPRRRGRAARPRRARPARRRPGCTYDTCGLRRERVFFSERLVAGTRGTVAARPRFFGTFPLDSIVRGVPEAEADARVYRAERVRGGALSLVGTVLGLVAVVSAIDGSDGDCTVVGVGLGGRAAEPRRVADDRRWLVGRRLQRRRGRGGSRSPTGR
jgi:hypothetical protein